MNTTKVIAILASTAALASAMEAHLTPSNPDATFQVCRKVSDVPTTPGLNVAIASIGMPNFLPNDRNIEVIVISTKYKAEKAERDAQWDLINGENSDANLIADTLDAPRVYQVYPENASTESKLAYKDLQLAQFKAETDEERLKVMQEMLDLTLANSALGA